MKFAASVGDIPVVDNKFRSDWNEYVSWLSKKGYKGNPELDKNDLGGKMIDIYRKENPNTTVSRESIIPLQKEFQNYRQWVLDQAKAGKAQLAEGTTPDNFMKSLSIVDGIPGQRTTSFQFPQSYLQTLENGQTKSVENTGFSTIK